MNVKARLYLLVPALIGLAACNPSAQEKKAQQQALQTSNEMTTYVGGLQQDTKMAQQAVNKMNRGTEKSEAAVAGGDN